MNTKLKKLIDFAKGNEILLLLISIAYLFRFDGNQLPALFGPDSVKYAVPLPIIEKNYFEWLFIDGLNFSPLYRSISYLIQYNNNGAIDLWIPIQQGLGILETVMFYFISLSLSKGNKVLSFLAALIFSLNPLKLYYEHYIMAEGLFVFFIICSIFLFTKLSDSLSSNKRISLVVFIYTLLFGLSLGAIVLSKEIQILQITILLALIIFSIKDILKEKNFTLLILTSIVFLSSFAVELPLMIYNHKKFNRFSVTGIPIQGGLLWALNEDIVRKSNSKPKWLQNTILATSNSYKKKQGLDIEKDNLTCFHNAVSLITTLGREGKLKNPVSKEIISSEEFSKIGSSYAITTQLSHPMYLLKRVLGSVRNILLRENHTFKTFIPSSNVRTNSKYEPINTFLPIPYSFSEKISPKVKDLPLVSTQYLTEDKWFKDAKHSQEYRNVIPLMVDRKTDKALAYSKTSLSILWMDILRFIPFGYFIFPIFLFSLFLFFYKKDFLKIDLRQYYVLGLALFFVLLISLISYGEIRYSLYILPPMLLFSISVLARL